MNQFAHNLSSASPDEAKSALIALFNAFPLAGHDDMRQVVGTYLIAIDGYCLAAIQKAVLRFIRGEAAEHDGRFMPTPAQLSREVKYRQSLMTPPTPRQALPAPAAEELSEAERLRVADKIREWVKARTPETATGFKPREPGDIVRELREKQFTLSPAAKSALKPMMSEEEYRKWLGEKPVPDPAEQYEAYSGRGRDAA